jgi:hypothetical protein
MAAGAADGVGGRNVAISSPCGLGLASGGEVSGAAPVGWKTKSPKKVDEIHGVCSPWVSTYTPFNVRLKVSSMVRLGTLIDCARYLV